MTRSILLIVFSVPLLAQPTITCPAAVNQGVAVACTSSAPVTWSLVGLGTLAAVDSLHATYTAPSKVAPQQQWGGCQVLPNDHIYNTRIDSLPVDSNSAAMIAAGAAGVNGGPPGDFGFNSVASGSPAQSLVFYYEPGNNATYYIPARPFQKIENGVDTAQIGGLDRHMITVARDTCNEQEIYALYPAGLQTSCPLCTSQGGTSYPLSSYALPSGTTDAAGMLLGPATYKKAEIMAQSINHAGRFTMSVGFILPAVFRWPAQSTTGGGGPWPMGARVRLKSSFNVSGLTNVYARALATAWQKYGIILADIGTDWNYQIESESYPQIVQEGFSQLYQAINNNNFEVIDESSLMATSVSGITTSPAVTVAGTPSSGTAGKANIALLGVTMGTDFPSLTVQAGTAAFQVNVWVNGSSNTGIAWTLTGDGSLSSSGVYTAPPTESAITTASITATSIADGTVSLVIPVTLLPGGAIRINTGDSSTFTDSLSQLWYGDQDTTYPVSPLIGTPYNQGGLWNTPDNTALFANVPSGYSNDYVYPIHMPNGNYQVSFLTGSGAGELPNQRCGEYEAQAQIGVHNYDPPGRGVPDLTGVTVTVPALVTNGLLTAAGRWAPCLGTVIPYSGWNMAMYGVTYRPLLAAFSIVPDSTPPHLTIDNTLEPGQSLSFSQTLQLYPVYWYIGPGVTWSIVSGQGTIDSTGLYTAPSTPTAATVTVKATSTVDGAVFSTTTIPVVFGAMIVSAASSTVAHTLTDQMSVTINGVPYTNIAWSISPSVGSIDSSGLYTAPPYLASDTTITVTATSRDDPTKSGDMTITATILLSSIRVNTGDTGGFIDASGNVWNADPGMQGDPVARYSLRNSVIGNAPVDMQPLYRSATYGHGDSYYLYLVPNSRYRVTLKFADYGGDPPGTYMASWLINGVPVMSNFDIEAAAGGPLTAVDRSFVVAVAGHTLKIEGIAAPGKLMQLNGFEIDDLGPARSFQLSGKTGLSGKTQ